jgi:hypothetical protein
VVGVHVLHVDGKVAQTPHTHARAQIDRLMCDPMLACEGTAGCMAVTDQQRLTIPRGQQVAVELRSP